MGSWRCGPQDEISALVRGVLEKTLESPLDCKEIQPVHSKGDQSWVFFGRTDAKAETPVLWPPHVKSWLIGKDSDAGRDWGQEEKGTIEDEMARWHHRLDEYESEWTPGVGDGQGGLVMGSWGHKESDTTEQLNWMKLFINPIQLLGFSLSLISATNYPWELEKGIVSIYVAVFLSHKHERVGLDDLYTSNIAAVYKLLLHTTNWFNRNGNPLQCSCLENPRDGGAWWAAICGVAQSRTRLKWLSSSSNETSSWIVTASILVEFEFNGFSPLLYVSLSCL